MLVVDSTDHERFTEVQEELVTTLNDSHLRVLVVILANKQDLLDVISPSNLCDALQLQDLPKGHPWQIHATIATKGDGMQEAIVTLRMQSLR
ncbi:ADP-ribosylation factor-like [Acanthaster planci]|uniref:ADP-ribosylation factor-like n=1 Tax=Acanthaster planci TaxID=133434 RepID=A0A8B7YZP6_ACAPL|nr:ADP-ribosylation factor-like [Acanthaster planci]